jgi:hypothetical protein
MSPSRTKRDKTMPRTFNAPNFRNSDGEQKIKRYVHSRLTIDHNGIQGTITENGRVIVTGIPKAVEGSANGEMEYDEIEVPASFIFKIASLLKATRQVKYMTLSELQAGGNKVSASEEDIRETV